MEEKLRFSKTFRFEISSEKTDIETVIYVLHGYGQLARYFLRKFQFLFDDYLVVAPEGMHRFYLSGSQGRVGASWMTKEAREDDIRDNIEWLDALDRQITEKYRPKRKILLGFSQGGATAARWFHKGSSNFDGLILWASVFPPDLDQQAELKQQPNQHFAIGAKDAYYLGDTQEEIIASYQDFGFEITRFDGAHDIEREALESILKKINSHFTQR